MPFQLSAGDRKIMLVAGTFFLVLMAATALLLSPDGDSTAAPTTWSTDSSGAKAAFLLLKEMGYPVERYERSPLELPKLSELSKTSQTPKTSRGVAPATLIVAEPAVAAGQDEIDALRQFVKDGGQLIAIGPTASALLPGGGEAIQPDPIGGMGWDKFPALAPADITRAAPRITMSPRAYWSSPGTALALYGRTGRKDQAVVVRYSYGEGTVLWWAAATPLTNAGLKEPGNLEFFVSCLGGKETPILWDEYFHGYRHSERNATETRLFAGLLIQAGLLGLAIVWTFSRRSGPLRPSLPESRLSPLEFVETLGNLYHRAGAASVAVDIYYQRFMYWLTRRLGMPRDEGIEQIEQAMSKRWNFHDATFGEVLKECAAARLRPNLAPRRALALVRSLHAYAAKLKLFEG